MRADNVPKRPHDVRHFLEQLTDSLRRRLSSGYASLKQDWLRARRGLSQQQICLRDASHLEPAEQEGIQRIAKYNNALRSVQRMTTRAPIASKLYSHMVLPQEQPTSQDIPILGLVTGSFAKSLLSLTHLGKSDAVFDIEILVRTDPHCLELWVTTR